MNKIDSWFETFKGIKQLSFNEAKDKFEKAILINDEEQQQREIDEIVLGTMHVIYQYLKSANIQMFETGSYDVDDMINSLIEKWIFSIKTGLLLKTASFSQMLHSKVIPNAMRNVVSTDEKFYEKTPYYKSMFVMCFNKYVELRNKCNGDDISYKTFVEYLIDNINGFYEYDLAGLYEYFKILYNRLEEKSDIKSDLFLAKIEDYFYLLMEIGNYERIGNEVPLDYDVEELVIKKRFLEEFRSILEDYELPDRSLEILYKRYGLDGKGAKTLEHLAENYNMSKALVRQKEAKMMRKLRTINDLKIINNDL